MIGMIKVDTAVNSADSMNDPRVRKILGQCYEQMAYLYDPKDTESLRPVWSDAIEKILPELGIESSVPWDSLSDEIKDIAMEQAAPIFGFDAMVQQVEHLRGALPIPDQLSFTLH